MALPFSSQTLFNISMGIYLITFLGYLVYATSQRRKVGSLSTLLLIIGLILHSVGLVFRWIETHQTGYGYVPLSNMYESLVFFSWTIVLIYLILELKYQQRIIGVFVTPLAFLAIALTSIVPGVTGKITPLMPALQSNWLTIHVTTCFFGYASFAVSCMVSALYLFREEGGRSWKLVLLWLFLPLLFLILLIDRLILKSMRDTKEGRLLSWLPPASVLDEINYKAIVIGFPMLTLGIITGAAWANYAWGTYWSWDSKETWSLITWFIYAAFLHARLTRDWRGNKAAVFSVFGFYAVLFTYFGVNYIISGLHSYA